jgi:hypothetical protein
MFDCGKTAEDFIRSTLFRACPVISPGFRLGFFVLPSTSQFPKVAYNQLEAPVEP